MQLPSLGALTILLRQHGRKLPWFQGTGQLHPFLTMNFLCLSPQNREISPLLGLDFFPGKQRETIS